MPALELSESQIALLRQPGLATLSCISTEYGIHSVLVNYVPSPDWSQFFVLSRPSARKAANIAAHGVASLVVVHGTSYVSLSCRAYVDHSTATRSAVETLFESHYQRPPRQSEERVILVLEPIRAHGQVTRNNT